MNRTNDITLTAVFSCNNSGGYHAYIEEIPELSTQSNTMNCAISMLTQKLQLAIKNTSMDGVDGLKLDFKFKHTIARK
jgi:predicted RNase H-like HicB family nuclease